MTVTIAATAASAVPRGSIVPIAHVSAVNANSIDFANIPGSYRDLMLVVNTVASAVSTGTGSWTRVNGDTAANYSYTGLKGDGTSLTTYRAANQSNFWATDTYFGNNTPGHMIIHLFNYSDTSRLKHGLIRLSGDANGSGSSQTYAITWKQTTAINQLSLFTSGGNGSFANMTGTLYGIRGMA